MTDIPKLNQIGVRVFEEGQWNPCSKLRRKQAHLSLKIRLSLKGNRNVFIEPLFNHELICHSSLQSSVQLVLGPLK